MKLTESHLILMTILEKTAMIVQPKHEQDLKFIRDAKELAAHGLTRVGYDKTRKLFALKITDAGRRALSEGDRNG